MWFLFGQIPPVLFTLILTLSHLTSATKEISKITWVNALASPQQLESYLSGPHRMAREAVTFNAKKDAIVMGKDPAGSLPLADCLKTLKASRNGHGVKLEMPSFDVYNASMEVVSQLGEADWINLHFDCFRGPMGGEAPIKIKELPQVIEMWPSGAIIISLGMTTAYAGAAAKGYTLELITNMAEDWRAGPFNTITYFDFVVDIYHISETEKVLWDPVYQKLKMVRRIELQLTPEMEGKVKMDAFRGFVEKLEMEQCYFNVPDAFRKRFFEAAEKEKEEPGRQNGDSWERGRVGMIYGVVAVVVVVGWW